MASAGAGVRLTVAEARGLAAAVMAALGHDAESAGRIADHLLDCELRGLAYGGLARALSIAERLGRSGDRRRPIAVERETPVSARIDGGDHLGYLVAERATRLAIEKARACGLAVVGAHDTWYTGMLSYYAEMAAAEGLVSIIASSATAWVAPEAASEGRYGTNPICFGFPSTGDPLIWDIGTSAILHAQVVLAGRLGEPLPEGTAFDGEGRATRDPAAALAGCFAPWGGHKGSGLGLVVQLLGVLAGAPIQPPDLAGFGFLILVLRPGLLGDETSFPRQVAEYAELVRSARPLDPATPVRVPFERSAATRRRRLQADVVELPEALYRQLVDLAGRPPGHPPP